MVKENFTISHEKLQPKLMKTKKVIATMSHSQIWGFLIFFLFCLFFFKGVWVRESIYAVSLCILKKSSGPTQNGELTKEGRKESI